MTLVRRRRFFSLTIPPVSAILAVMIIFRRLVFESGYLIYRDLYPGQFIYPYLWHPLGSFLALENYKFITYTGLFLPLRALGEDVYEKAVYLGAALIAYLAFYYAACRLSGYIQGGVLTPVRRHLASMLGALTFIANPAAVNIFFDFSLFVGYAFSPLILLIYSEMLAGKRRRGPSILLVAGLWWLSAIKAHWIIFGGLLLLPPLFIWLLSHWPDRHRLPYRSNILSTAAIVFVYLLLSAYWLIPFLQASQHRFVGSYAPMTYESIAFLSNTPWSQTARLLGVFQAWPYVAYRPPSDLLRLPWSLASWIIPLMAAAGLLWHRRRWIAWTLAVLAIGGIFLAKGVAPPFGGLYKGLVFGRLTPDAFRWLFRVSSKWNVFASLGMSGLVALAAAELLRRARFNHPIRTRLFTRPDRRSGAALALLLAYCLAFPFYAWPSFSGDLSGALAPVDLPASLEQANRWLAEQPGDYKVNWMPVTNGRELSWNQRPSGALYTALSSRPSIATSWNRHPVLYYSYAYDSVASQRTANLGELLSILNTRYVAYHDDVITTHIHEGVEPVAVLIEEGEEKITAQLGQQRDLRLAWQQEFLSIYESSQAAPPLFVPAQRYLTTGDLTLLNALSGLAAFQPQQAGLYFDASCDSGIYPGQVDGLILGRDAADQLVVAQLPAERLISPAAFTRHGSVTQDWSRFDIYQFDWQSVLREHQVYSWGFDYGQNMAAHTAGPGEIGGDQPKLEVPLDVATAGRYHLWLRYLGHPRAGELAVTIDDGQPVTIAADRPITDFQWQDLGPLRLAAGQHTISLANQDGFMAVNALALIEEEELMRLQAQSRAWAGSLPNLYWLEAEDDFDLGHLQLSRQTTALSNGRGVALTSGAVISASLEVVTPGAYHLALRASLPPAAAPLT
ncbi:MAG: hypothetical protein ACK2UH_16560, partial [Candidatus Promineifilaceae bacterium]